MALGRTGYPIQDERGQPDETWWRPSAVKDIADVGALISGASGRLGTEIAARLDGHGARLVLAGRDANRLEAVAAELGRPAWALTCDLTDPVAIDRLAEDATARLGGVELLICAAGLDTITAATDQSDEQVTAQLAVNLAGPIRLTRRVLPSMLSRRRGHIVYVGTLTGLAGGAYQAPYAAATGGLDAWTRALRAEHRGSGVGFSIVHPAPIRDAGAYPARRRRHGPPPGHLGEATAGLVADAVVQAIRRDRPQIVVASRLVRAQLAVQALSPRSAERLAAVAGVPAYFREVASGRPRCDS